MINWIKSLFGLNSKAVVNSETNWPFPTADKPAANDPEPVVKAKPKATKPKATAKPKTTKKAAPKTASKKPAAIKAEPKKRGRKPKTAE